MLEVELRTSILRPARIMYEAVPDTCHCSKVESINKQEDNEAITIKVLEII